MKKLPNSGRFIGTLWSSAPVEKMAKILVTEQESHQASARFKY